VKIEILMRLFENDPSTNATMFRINEIIKLMDRLKIIKDFRNVFHKIVDMIKYSTSI
jgi:hypothetical protein